MREAMGRALERGAGRRGTLRAGDCAASASSATSSAIRRPIALPEELAQARGNDPLPRFKQGVTEAQPAGRRRPRRHRAEVLAEIEDAVAEALVAPRPDISDARNRRLRKVLICPRKSYRQAINEALARRDAPRSQRHHHRRGRRRRPGRDRARPAASAACSASPRGIFKEFGPERVLDTPISESAIIGAACGRGAHRHAAGGRDHVRRLRRRLLRPDLQPGRQVPLHVRRQGQDADGDPHR